MKSYQQIKSEHQKAYNDLITKHKVFFAFSDNQLKEGMAKIGADITIKDIIQAPAGMFILKSELAGFMEAIERAEVNNKKELKEAKQEKENAIIYELRNHECFISGSIDDVVDIFKGRYFKSL